MVNEIVVTSGYPNIYTVGKTQSVALADINCLKNNNDIVLKKLFLEYPDDLRKNTIEL